MKRKIQLTLVLFIGILIGQTSNAFAAIGEMVEAKFAEFNFKVDGTVKKLESNPLVYNGTTYLPVRIVANLLGKDVVFKADSKTIELNTPRIVTKEGKSNVIDFREYTPEVIRNIITSLKADIGREKDAQIKAELEAKVEEMETYLSTVPIAETINIEYQLRDIEWSINSAKEYLERHADDENMKKALADLESQKAELEAKLK